MPDKSKKKEKVLHTRVPESLDSELKKKAGSLGLSVSSLVRNILSNTFGLVEDIVVDSANIARAARGESDDTQPVIPTPYVKPQILGWQKAVLNLNAVCDTCNTLLTKGTCGAIAVTDTTGLKPIICEDCLKELTHDSAKPPDQS